MPNSLVRGVVIDMIDVIVIVCTDEVVEYVLLGDGRLLYVGTGETERRKLKAGAEDLEVNECGEHPIDRLPLITIISISISDHFCLCSSSIVHHARYYYTHRPYS